MSESLLTPTQVNGLWAEAMRSIRHAQLNELQLISSYSKMRQSEKLERCVALMLEQLEQERRIQSFGEPVWLARLLPLVYGIGRVKFRFSELVYINRAAELETDWRCSENVEQILLSVAHLFNIQPGIMQSPEALVIQTSIRLYENQSELRMNVQNEEQYERLFAFTQTVPGNPEITGMQADLSVMVRWLWG